MRRPALRVLAASSGVPSPLGAGGPLGKPAPAKPQPKAGGDGPSLDLSHGLAALVALNGAVFAGAAFAKLPPLAGLALYTGSGAWWQYATSAFVHANLTHLSRNMFLLWLWGSALRREVTGPGVWFTYVLSAAAANWSAASVLGPKASLLGIGASGGVAGVFLATLLLTARPSLRWLLGAALALQFTVPALLAAPVPYLPATAGNAAAAGLTAVHRLLPPWVLDVLGEGVAGGAVGAAKTGYVGGLVAALKAPGLAWLWGAAAGALVVVVLARLPVPPE